MFRFTIRDVLWLTGVGGLGGGWGQAQTALNTTSVREEQLLLEAKVARAEAQRAEKVAQSAREEVRKMIWTASLNHVDRTLLDYRHKEQELARIKTESG